MSTERTHSSLMRLELGFQQKLVVPNRARLAVDRGVVGTAKVMC